MGRDTQTLNASTFHGLPSFLSLTSLNRGALIIWPPVYPVPWACPLYPICGHSAVLRKRAGPYPNVQKSGRFISVVVEAQADLESSHPWSIGPPAEGAGSKLLRFLGQLLIILFKKNTFFLINQILHEYKHFVTSFCKKKKLFSFMIL